MYKYYVIIYNVEVIYYLLLIIIFNNCPVLTYLKNMSFAERSILNALFPNNYSNLIRSL